MDNKGYYDLVRQQSMVNRLGRTHNLNDILGRNAAQRAVIVPLSRTNEPLAKYRSMRSEGETPEPFGGEEKEDKHLVFVVQKHDATRLHYDFRLEVNGVMPSWAVPKGPTMEPTVKRLAMQTEDHPMDYRHFAGTIPEGQYGAGTVEIWDEGYYEAEIEIKKGVRKQIKDKKEGNGVMEEGLKKGELKFFLHGKKLKGSFALFKTRGFGGKDNAWLLMKHREV